ncbi:autotransporter outer membrane beta-barrel domain-containing protein [Dyadobacter crusticola]|uniref:autotransporter outer membrane beta-barrel domain-containing protein n=1 Tax=Dyadobacter crusticola TaxID=292407 RepID=UPI00146F9584|nr:autotransporter outer membrane beta-barrel domain-containing protein [Dyadobacter crusticola]
MAADIFADNQYAIDMNVSARVILIFIFAFPFQSIAQRQPLQNRFELEADPIAFILNGYSLHAGYTMSHMRFDIGIYGIKQPKFALENKHFSVFSSGVGLKADYLLRKNKGLFFGLQSDYATDKISLRTSDDSQSVSGLTLGLRAGYRFMLGSKENQYRGFYLVPWVAFIHSFNPSNVTRNAQQYIQSQWSVFPTIHLGYRF